MRSPREPEASDRDGHHNGELVRATSHQRASEASATRLTLIWYRREPQRSSVRISAPVVVPNPQGLHARPAAVLANLAKRFRSEVQLVRGDEHVNAKSVVALMTMRVSHGEMVRFRATGEDAEEAVAALAEALSEGLGEEGSAPPAPAAAPVAPPPPSPTIPEEPGVLRGVGASPGLAVGKVFQLRRQEMEVAEIGGDPAHERRRLDAALEQAKGELEMLQARMTAEADPAKAGIFAAHRELLDDPDLVEVAQAGIAAGKSAGYAWKRAYSAQVERLSTLKNELLAARATDRDVGNASAHGGGRSRQVEMRRDHPDRRRSTPRHGHLDLARCWGSPRSGRRHLACRHLARS